MLVPVRLNLNKLRSLNERGRGAFRKAIQQEGRATAPQFGDGLRLVVPKMGRFAWVSLQVPEPAAGLEHQVSNLQLAPQPFRR